MRKNRNTKFSKQRWVKFIISLAPPVVHCYLIYRSFALKKKSGATTILIAIDNPVFSTIISYKDETVTLNYPKFKHN